MHSDLENLRRSTFVPQRSLVLKYALCACVARSWEELLSLCLRCDEGDYPNVTGPMERIHDKITARETLYFRDFQHTAKQYVRDHL